MEDLEVNLGWWCPKCQNHWIFHSNSIDNLCWKCNTPQKLETYTYSKDDSKCTFNDLQIIRRL